MADVVQADRQVKSGHSIQHRTILRRRPGGGAWANAPTLPSPATTSYTTLAMINPTQPNIKLTTTQDYRETYANSVQVRVNVWDFFLVFGTLQQQSENEVELRNFQGIYLSPQQAKALSAILQQNLAGYESTFGEIKLDPRMMGAGPVN
jgi:hypothetical protein